MNSSILASLPLRISSFVLKNTRKSPGRLMFLPIEFAFASSREGAAPREASFTATVGLASIKTPLAPERLLLKWSSHNRPFSSTQPFQDVDKCPCSFNWLRFSERRPTPSQTSAESDISGCLRCEWYRLQQVLLLHDRHSLCRQRSTAMSRPFSTSLRIQHDFGAIVFVGSGWRMGWRLPHGLDVRTT
jgi:hypothetical protein